MCRLITSNLGFTLVETVITLAVISVILSFGTVVDLSAFKGDTFRSEETTIVSALQKARSRSMSNFFNVAHGVCYIEPNYIIFRDRSTCLPTTETDEKFPANYLIRTASNFSTDFPTIVFDQITSNTTSTTIYLTDGIKETNIIINNAGAINW